MFPRSKKMKRVLSLLAIALLSLMVWGWDRLVGNEFFSFHGRVVGIDQAPLPNANVTVLVSRYDFFQIPMMWKNMAKTMYPVMLTTDANGAFTTGVLHGESIRVTSIAKVGFDGGWINHEDSTFTSGNRVPGSSRINAGVPTYVLAPLGPSDGNVEGSIDYHLIVDGRQYAVDLVTEKIGVPLPATGDLTVAINGLLGPHGHPKERWDWSVKLESLGDGEFVETSDPVPMKAPDTGYRRDFAYEERPAQRDFSVKDPSWSGGLNRTFYYRSKDRHLYAWIKVQLDSISMWNRLNEGGCEIHYVYNTQGSPNLFRPQK